MIFENLFKKKLKIFFFKCYKFKYFNKIPSKWVLNIYDIQLLAMTSKVGYKIPYYVTDML